jgi:uncharacterized membrane protein YuzA (DUF378 family)
MKALDTLAAALVIICAINWGLVGAARIDLVAALFGQSIVASIVYVLVGVAGAYQIGRWSTSGQPELATA